MVQSTHAGRFVDLAGDLHGGTASWAPIVLLHGLSFDRRMWTPVITALTETPGRIVLALDLPGHGESPDWPSYELDHVAAAVHNAVAAARLEAPVVVGHSIGAVIATIYAARYPARGVVNVDQPLRVGPFASLVQSQADALRGPDFPAVWELFASSMHPELLSNEARQIVETTSRPRQAVVLGYWADVMTSAPEELEQRVAAGLSTLRARGTPYLVVTGSPLAAGEQQWLRLQLPQARFVIVSGSGHFPHLADPHGVAHEVLESVDAPSERTR